MASSHTKPRKILYFVTVDWYFLSHRLPLAKAALKKGFEVVLVTKIERSQTDITKHGIKVIPIDINRSGLNPLKELLTIAKIWKIYQKERPDIVHHVALKPVLYGSFIARLLKVRGIVNALGGLGYVFKSESLKAKILRPFINQALRLALLNGKSRLILQNEDDKALIIEKHLADRHAIKLIKGAGVKVENYTDKPHDFKDDPLIILPSRLLKDKGIYEFMLAARTFKSRGKKARFALVGTPDLSNPNSVSLKEIQQWVDQGVLEYWGWRKDMPDVLAQSSLVCLPTFYGEGLPKSLLEAAASCRPIITTDIAGCREIVRPGVNGWLIKPKSAKALVSALEEALDNPELCKKYGLSGRKIAQEEFTIERVINETMQIYDEIT